MRALKQRHVKKESSSHEERFLTSERKGQHTLYSSMTAHAIAAGKHNLGRGSLVTEGLGPTCFSKYDNRQVLMKRHEARTPSENM